MKKKDSKNLKRAFSLLASYKVIFCFSVLFLIISIVISLIHPYLWGSLITMLFSKESKMIVTLILWVLALYSLQTLFEFLHNVLIKIVQERVVRDLKSKVFAKLLKMSIRDYSSLEKGSVFTRLNEDTQDIAEIVTQQLVDAVISVMKLIVLGIIVFLISPILAIVTIVMFPLNYIVFKIFTKKLKRNKEKQRLIADSYYKNVQETFNGFEEIKSLHICSIRGKLFEAIINKLLKINVLQNNLSKLVMSLSAFCRYLSQIVLYSVGAYLTFNGIIGVDMFIAFSSYAQMFSGAIGSIMNINITLQQSFIALNRIFSFIDELDYKSENFGEISLLQIKGLIEFKHVKFKYTDQDVLDDVSFCAYPNGKCVLVGMSGSGKSTILKLLERFYDPNEGEICIDGVNVKDLNESSLRSSISIVHQEEIFFSGSIKDNLLMANPSALMDDICHACTIAKIDEFINTLEDGYDTLLTDNGRNLSGGQKKRLSIARAILRNTKIILFDEPTSSIDSNSSVYLSECINELAKDHTVILISHKLLDVLDADKIVVIENGRVVGEGSHDTLIKSNQYYKNIYSSELIKYQNTIS